MTRDSPKNDQITAKINSRVLGATSLSIKGPLSSGSPVSPLGIALAQIFCAGSIADNNNSKGSDFNAGPLH